MGTFWNHFGIMLEPFWDDFGIFLGSFWNHFGLILEPFWADFGIILESFWDIKDLRKNEGLGSRRFLILLHPRAIQIRNDFLVSGNFSVFFSYGGGCSSDSWTTPLEMRVIRGIRKTWEMKIQIVPSKKNVLQPENPFPRSLI